MTTVGTCFFGTIEEVRREYGTDGLHICNLAHLNDDGKPDPDERRALEFLAKHDQ